MSLWLTKNVLKSYRLKSVGGRDSILSFGFSGFLAGAASAFGFSTFFYSFFSSFGSGIVTGFRAILAPIWTLPKTTLLDGLTNNFYAHAVSSARAFYLNPPSTAI
jgi:hypothetical protein